MLRECRIIRRSPCFGRGKSAEKLSTASPRQGTVTEPQSDTAPAKVSGF